MVVEKKLGSGHQKLAAKKRRVARLAATPQSKDGATPARAFKNFLPL